MILRASQFRSWNKTCVAGWPKMKIWSRSSECKSTQVHSTHVYSCLRSALSGRDYWESSGLLLTITKSINMIGRTSLLVLLMLVLMSWYCCPHLIAFACVYAYVASAVNTTFSTLVLHVYALFSDITLCGTRNTHDREPQFVHDRLLLKNPPWLDPPFPGRSERRLTDYEFHPADRGCSTFEKLWIFILNALNVCLSNKLHYVSVSFCSWIHTLH